MAGARQPGAAPASPPAPWTVLTLAALLLTALAAGLPGLSLNASYQAYFDADDPVLATQRNVGAAFGQYGGVVLALTPATGDALNPTFLETVEAVAARARTLPDVVRVISPAAVGAGDELAATDPGLAEELGLDESSPPPDRGALAADPRGAGLLLARDFGSAIVDIAYDLPPSASGPDFTAALAALRGAVGEVLAGAPIEIEARYTGTLTLNAAYVDVIQHDLRVFLPAMAVLFFTLLTWLFGSPCLAVMLLAVAAVAVVGAFGAGGWLGLELAAVNAFAPVIITSMAIAGGVHMLGGISTARAAGHDTPAAIDAALAENALPLALTSLTTALGFLALLLSPSPPIRVVGLVAAAGVMLGWLANRWLLPALLSLLPPGRARARADGLPFRRLARWTGRHPRALVLSCLALLITSLWLVTGNEINDNVFDYFPSSHAFRQDTGFVSEHFSGVNKVSYVLDAGRRQGVFDTGMIERSRAFSGWARQQQEVRHVVSLADLPPVAARLEAGDADSALARYRRLAADFRPAELGLEQLVDEDLSALAVHLYLEDLDARRLIAFDARATAWLAEHGAPYAFAGGAGSALVYAHLGQRNARSMVLALGAALAGIALLFGLVLRSARAAWVGLVCNVLPVLSVYAWWAVVDGRISLGGAVVLGMILGIIVDDTIYLLTRYQRLRRQGDPDPVGGALAGVGPAITVTTVTLCAGLATGMLSAFTPIAAMSLLSVCIIAVALFVDLIFLPALLRLGAAPEVAA